MAVRGGLGIAVVLALHCVVADIRAAAFGDWSDSDATDTDSDDPTVTVTATATATATAVPTSSLVTATSGVSSDNATSSSGASSSSGADLDQGTKAGIAIGVVLGVCFLAGAIFMITRRWLRNRRANGLSPHDPNNPHLLVANNVPLPGDDRGPGSEEKRSMITTSSAGGGAYRPWFDTGMGSTELEAGSGGGHGQAKLSGPSVWAQDKTELPTPGRDATLELPGAERTRLEPVELPAELPAAMPLMPPDPNQDNAVDGVGRMGTWRRGSQNTWATGTSSSPNTGTFVSSPTGTSSTGDVFQGAVSPYSTNSDGNNAGKAKGFVESPTSVLSKHKD